MCGSCGWGHGSGWVSVGRRPRRRQGLGLGREGRGCDRCRLVLSVVHVPWCVELARWGRGRLASRVRRVRAPAHERTCLSACACRCRVRSGIRQRLITCAQAPPPLCVCVCALAFADERRSLGANDDGAQRGGDRACGGFSAEAALATAAATPIDSGSGSSRDGGSGRALEPDFAAPVYWCASTMAGLKTSARSGCCKTGTLSSGPEGKRAPQCCRVAWR